MRIAASIAVDALAYGMVLFVITVGLSLMLGLMRVVNLAHGAFAMIGGYIASSAGLGWHAGYAAAIGLGVLGAIMVGWPLERLLYRRIYGAGALPQVLMTIGITFCVIGIANAIFGPTLKPIALPAFLAAPVDLGFRTIAGHRLFAIGAGAAIALGLWLVLERTAFGVALRATVDDPAMAAALGIRTDRLYSASFALAVGLAAFGGIVGAEILPVEPYYALRYMVTFLVVVSVGGAGSVGGALLASLLLGAIDTTARYFVPDLGELVFYLAVILIVSLFPRGLFARAA